MATQRSKNKHKSREENWTDVFIWDHEALVTRYIQLLSFLRLCCVCLRPGSTPQVKSLKYCEHCTETSSSTKGGELLD